MARKVLKRELRRVAAIVKQQFGYSIEDVGGPGIGPGVRLLARKGLAKIQIAVRTSHDRKVGLTRTKNGTWRTIPDVQEVLVAVIPDDDPTMVEIFCFEADNLQEAFERRLKYEPELRVSPDGSYPPVFMALDPIKNDEKFIKSNLQRKKSWSRRLPLTSGESAKPSITALRDFTDRTLKEYAAIVGADVADVVVEFRVVGRGNRE